MRTIQENLLMFLQDLQRRARQKVGWTSKQVTVRNKQVEGRGVPSSNLAKHGSKQNVCFNKPCIVFSDPKYLKFDHTSFHIVFNFN